MLRAGLGLDLSKLRRLGLSVLRLAVLPCLAEALTVALLSAWWLSLPPAWAGMLGFVVAAVSPAVVVPGMLDLQARNYGTAKGVPTLVVAAASFDDVLAIAGFGICLALMISSEGESSSDSVAWLVLKAPTELLSGVGGGIALGCVVAMPGTHDYDASRHTLGALGGALVAVFGGKALAFSGGGALATIVLGCTASRLWPEAARARVRAHVNTLWGLLQPALFGLLGAAVNLRDLETSNLAIGTGMLACSLLVRTLVTRLALLPSPLTPKEARLVCIAWLPKATVQAAVGGTALDEVIERGLGDEAKRRAELVLLISVLVILLTAPMGAIGIAVFGPKYLSHDMPVDVPDDVPDDVGERGAEEDEAQEGAIELGPVCEGGGDDDAESPRRDKDLSTATRSSQIEIADSLRPRKAGANLL